MNVSMMNVGPVDVCMRYWFVHMEMVVLPIRLHFAMLVRVGNNRRMDKKDRDVVGQVLNTVRKYYFAGCTNKPALSFLAMSPTLISPLMISASK